MGTWTSNTTFEGDPQQLVSTLTEIDSIERWAPLPFRIDEDVDCLRAGDHVSVEGALLGRGVRFRVDVARVDNGGLSLQARGPFDIDVDYTIEAGSRTVEARVETRSRGPMAKVLASAANAMLAAGALDHALRRVVQQAALSPVPAAA